MKFPWDAAKPLRVEVALNPASEAPAWRDVSALVKGGSGVRITRGGGDRHEDVPPGRCTFTLDNRTGDYSDTSGMAPSLFRKRVRVSYRTPGVAGNLVSANAASMETDASDWSSTTGFGAYTLCTVAHSAVRAWDGTKSVLLTWPTTAGGSLGVTVVTGLVIGRTYTFSAYVYVPTGSPDVCMTIALIANGSTTAVKNAWQRISITWTATQSTIQVGPRVTGSTAGQQCWVDGFQADEGSTVATFTTDPPPISYRFTGRIATNDLAFPALGLAETALVATDESAWQGPEFSTFADPVTQETLADNPAGMWPLTDGNLGDVSAAGGGPMVAVGAGSAPSTSSGSGTAFTGGQWLKGALSKQIGGFLSVGVTLEATATIDPATVTEGTVATVGGAYGPSLVLTVGADGKARARTWNVFTPGVWSASVISSQAINDGQPHHLATTWTTSTGTLRLYVDGVSAGSVVSSNGAGRLEAAGVHVTVGGATHVAELTGTVSNVAVLDGVLSGARVAEHANGALTGFTGDTVTERIDRYNRWAGTPHPIVDYVDPAAIVGNYDTDGKSLTDAINAVATVEDGLAYINGSGALILRGRSTLINTDPAFTIPGPTDGAANRVRGSLSYSTNPRTFVNDITGTMPGGITYRATDAASVAEYGRTTDTVEGPFATVEDLAAVIEWRVRTESTPRPAVEGLSVRLSQLDDADTAALLALDLGDVIAWTGMPDQAPSATDSGVVLGIEETYTHTDLLWTATSASATSGLNVLIFDDPVRGVLDSTNVFGY